MDTLAAVLFDEFVVVESADHFNRVLGFIVFDELAFGVINRVIHRLQQAGSFGVEQPLVKALNFLLNRFSFAVAVVIGRSFSVEDKERL